MSINATQLIVTLILLALGLYFVDAIDFNVVLKRIIRAVVIVLAVLSVLHACGLLPGFSFH